MSYHPMRRSLVMRRGVMSVSGLGDFTDSDQCSTIPIGDPYRKPGNYCATPDGGTTTFNADGSTYRAPGITVDPDPAHPAGAASSGAGGILNAILGAIHPRTPPFAPPPVTASSGPSTTTLVAIGAGAVVLALVLSRRKS